MASSLTERIESLDEETRVCWERVEELEDEEASLTRRLAKLEKVRRGQRLEILEIEQLCKAAEVAMLQAQEEAANLDGKAQDLEIEAQNAADVASTSSADKAAFAATSHQSDWVSGRDTVVNGPEETLTRLEGSTALVAALGRMPAHEEKRNQLISMLQQTERETRGEIAEAARSTAELRRSAKKQDAERGPLEDDTSNLRKQLAEMADDHEIQSRIAHVRQIEEGLDRRLQYAQDELVSVRDALAHGPAKHMEEEEQQSLELMQGIAEAKTRLQSREGVPDFTPLSKSCAGRAGVGEPRTPTSSKQPTLEMRPARGRAGKRNYLESSRSHGTWGGSWS